MPRMAAQPAAESPASPSRSPAPGALGLDRTGLAYGAAAYLWWAAAALYYKVVKQVSSLEVLSHRVLWSALLLMVLCACLARASILRAALGRPRVLAGLALTSILIAVNWLTFIYATATDHVLQASLGYFINPLVSVLMGFVLLRERLNRLQWCSVALATSGVAMLVLAQRSVPALALILAFSFATYGLLRKLIAVDALVGLALETTLLAPPAAAYLAWLLATHQAVFTQAGRLMDLTLLSAGVITAFPLLWFTIAARRLPLTTLGFLQYLAPTGQFLLAVFVFGEPFAGAQLVSFGLIWAGLGLFSFDVVRRARVGSAALGGARG